MNESQVMTVFAIIAANLSTVLTFFFHGDKKMEAHRLEAQKMLENHRVETKEILVAIKDEMKDFHDKLYALEERRKL